MYFLIVGGGTIGTNLSEYLLAAGHESVIVEENPAQVETLQETFGRDVVEGDGSKYAVLKTAGCSRADVLIATTRYDAVNLATCQIAKDTFKIDRTVSIVNSQENVPVFREGGVDTVISTADLVFSQLHNVIPALPPTRLMSVRKDRYEIVAITASSAVAGLTTGELELPDNCSALMIIPASNEPIPAAKDTKIPPDSTLMLLIPTGMTETVWQKLVGEHLDIA